MSVAEFFGNLLLRELQRLPEFRAAAALCEVPPQSRSTPRMLLATDSFASQERLAIRGLSGE
jgi:hypothetical protein